MSGRGPYKEPEVVLTGIVKEMMPEVERLVDEIGREQVIRNIESGLAKLRARIAERESTARA